MLCHLKENELSIENEKICSIVEKKHSCDQCAKSFRCQSHLERHKRIHNGQRPFICNICRMAFNQPEILAKHRESHQGKKKYRCNRCLQSFRFKVSLKSHILNLHPELDNTVRESYNNSLNCSECDKPFATKYKLQRHMRCHTGERPYSCNFCNRTFSQTGNLKLHQLKCFNSTEQILLNNTNLEISCPTENDHENPTDPTTEHYSPVYITESEIQKTINETINSSVPGTSSYLKTYNNPMYSIENEIETILDCDLELETTKYTTNSEEKLSLCMKQPESSELLHSLLYDV